MGLLASRLVVGGFKALQGEQRSLDAVSEILVPGAAGLLPTRVYHPRAGHLLPLLVFFHGGGWALGDVEASDLPCRALALAPRCVVASVQYRLSPETKFPGPAEDCFSATRWLSEHASDIGADRRATIVAGESAGGNLAAAVALMARDRNGPTIGCQLLIYPVLAPARNSKFRSYTDNAEGFLITRSDMEWFWDLYLSSPADENNPYASPLLAPDLTRLPAAMIVVAEFDPLCDEALAFAKRLNTAGIDVDVLNCAGLIHGFFDLMGVLDRSRELVADVGRKLRNRFERGGAAA
jgi:acetyl esterase